MLKKFFLFLLVFSFSFSTISFASPNKSQISENFFQWEVDGIIFSRDVYENDTVRITTVSSSNSTSVATLNKVTNELNIQVSETSNKFRSFSNTEISINLSYDAVSKNHINVRGPLYERDSYVSSLVYAGYREFDDDTFVAWYDNTTASNILPSDKRQLNYYISLLQDIDNYGTSSLQSFVGYVPVVGSLYTYGNVVFKIYEQGLSGEALISALTAGVQSIKYMGNFYAVAETSTLVSLYGSCIHNAKTTMNFLDERYS